MKRTMKDPRSKILNPSYVFIFIILTLFISGILDFGSQISFAATKVIKKSVNKIIVPKIQVNPDTEEGEDKEAPTLSPPPPAPPTATETNLVSNKKGLLGWDKNADVSGTYLINSRNQQGLFGTIGGSLNMVFEDSLKLGTKMGLAEDAVEYNLGLGLLIGNDANNLGIISIPLSFGGTLYLKEGSLFGTDPFVGLGFNYNLFGTGQGVGGPLGYKLSVGTLIDWGFESGKTRLSFGYNSFRVTDQRQAEGIFFSIGQPFKL